MRRESLRILEPCSADWERMDGDGTVRFCRLCKKDVHDLSQMREDEARALLSSGPQPCIRYLYDSRGEVLFADRPGLLPRLAAAAALTFGGLVAGGCMGKRSPETTNPDEVCLPPDAEPPQSVADSPPPDADSQLADPQPAANPPAAAVDPATRSADAP